MEWVVVGLFVLIPIAALVLWIFALVDRIQVGDDSMYQSGTKLIWVIVIATVIGAVIYLAVGRPKPGAEPSIRAAPPPPPPPAV
jgi:hypothetical protein